MSEHEKVSLKILTRVLGVEETTGTRDGRILVFSGYEFCFHRGKRFKRKKGIDTNGDKVRLGNCEEFRCRRRKVGCKACIVKCLESNPTRYFISSSGHTCVSTPPRQEKTNVIQNRSSSPHEMVQIQNYDDLMIPFDDEFMFMFGENFPQQLHFPNSERNFETDPNLIELPNTPFINTPPPSTFNPNEDTRTGKKRKLNDIGLTTSKIDYIIHGRCIFWIFGSFCEDDASYITSTLFSVRNGENRELPVISVRSTYRCEELKELLADESEEVRLKCEYSQFTVLVFSKSSTEQEVKLLIPNGNTIIGSVMKEEEEEEDHQSSDYDAEIQDDGQNDGEEEEDDGFGLFWEENGDWEIL